MKLYAQTDNLLSFETSVADIGFAIPSDMVSASGITAGTNFVLVSLYTFIANIVYFSCIVVFWRQYRFARLHDDTDHNTNQKTPFRQTIENYTRDNRKLITGASIVAALSVSSELLIKLVRCITWSVNIMDSFTSFIILWLPQLLFVLLVIGPNLLLHLHYLIVAYKKVRREHRNLSKNVTFYCLKILYDKHHIHNVLVLCLFIYLIIYSSFPTFILIFAYPTKMVAVVTFVLAFLFSMVVLFALLAHFYERLAPTRFTTENFKKLRIYTITFFLVALCVFLPVVAYFFGLLYVLLYVLVIGRASVVTTGPLAALSLLPSAILSGIAWIAKRSLAVPAAEDAEEQPSVPDRDESAAYNEPFGSRVVINPIDDVMMY